MAGIERVYVPPLWLSSQGRGEQALQAVRRLATAWEGFVASFGASDRLDAASAADLEAVSAAVARAASLLDPGPDGLAAEAERVHEAHEVLEGVRIRLREMRLRNGIEFYPDLLTAYHDPMEAIVLASRDEELDDEALRARLRALLPEARTLWNRVVTAEFDNAVFELTPQELAQREKLVAAEVKALADLAQALTEGSPLPLRPTARALKPPFAQQVLLFADLPENARPKP